MPLKVFISYAREDHAQAIDYFDRLTARGIDPWMDTKKLLPGQNWELEISQALNAANVVILLISPRSVSKRGFVQREANIAIERLNLKLPDDIYVIPVMLEACDVPSHISARLQYVDGSKPDSWPKILASLEIASRQQSIASTDGISMGPFLVKTNEVAEFFAGHPGHDIRISYPSFSSENRNESAKDLSLYFQGRAFRNLLESRSSQIEQDPETFNQAGEFLHTNGRWEDFGIISASSSIVSIVYNVGWYGAGAAHEYNHYETYNFDIRSKPSLLHLGHFFKDYSNYEERLSSLVIKALEKEYWERHGSEPEELTKESFSNGASPGADNFSNFVVKPEKFTFLFPPYQVASYADGSWLVDVSYYDLRDLLRPNGPHTFLNDNP